ncbi:hypothetical protein PSHT_00449, partial [Puccinia striiformis]
LTAQLAPAILDILNDSHLQRHHAAMKSVGMIWTTSFVSDLICIPQCESVKLILFFFFQCLDWFLVRIVSDRFLGKPVLARHQLAYRILDQELTKNTAGIHAISLKTLTSKEHQKST